KEIKRRPQRRAEFNGADAFCKLALNFSQVARRHAARRHSIQMMILEWLAPPSAPTELIGCRRAFDTWHYRIVTPAQAAFDRAKQNEGAGDDLRLPHNHWRTMRSVVDACATRPSRPDDETEHSGSHEEYAGR